MSSAKDPYRYFRVEAHDLIGSLGAGVLQLERSGSAELVERLMRLAHTLKGASRVVRQVRISEIAHALEDLLLPHRGSAQAIGSSLAGPMLALIDEAQALLEALDAPGPAATASGSAAAASPATEFSATTGARTGTRPLTGTSAPAQTEPDSPLAQGFLRVDQAGLEAAFLGLVEASTASGRLTRRLDGVFALAREARALDAELRQRAVTSPRLSALIDGLDDLAQEVGAEAATLSRRLIDLERTTHELVLVPAQQAFAQLERAVRDAATTLAREVHFETQGGEVRLDSELLGSVREALLHLVRNAVAHGIEPPEERRRHDKPVVGRVLITVTRRERRVRFEVSDDGRGLDVAAIARAALAKGRLDSEAAQRLDTEAAARLLLERGLSTRSEVDAVAGRGVGLDVASAIARSLGGVLSLVSKPGLGLVATLDLPLSRSAFPCLVVAVGGQQVAIPLEHVERAVSPEIVASSGRLEAVLDNRAVPYAHLGALLYSKHVQQSSLGVTLSVGARRAVLGVDRLLGSRELRSAPLPRWLPYDPLVASAWIDEEGLVRLILDAEAIIERCEMAERGKTAAPGPLRGGQPQATAPRTRIPVLVVDDSITTRMLEKSILEAAGYEVDLAVSGEDGLLRARSRRYGAFVVDVEMPGMDGYAFTRAVCADPELGRTPVILVTSRGDPEDRRRGAEAGARAHIAKGEFDQRHLLATMARLMEAP